MVAVRGRGYSGLFGYCLGAYGPEAINVKRACPPQMRSPAMSTQGLTSLPLAVASFRHVTGAHAGYRLALSGVSSISLLSSHAFVLCDSRDDFVVCFGSSARDNPQTSSRGWSRPIRLRYTRNTGRAQQRNTGAATGSSAFSTRIRPEPNRRNVLS